MDAELLEITDEFCVISLQKIRINPYQPRRIFNDEELCELAESIKSIGLIQPIVVRSLESETGLFELVAGERRFRASQKAGLKTIPAVVRKYSSMQSAEAALIENMQRVDLNPIEIASAIRSIMLQFELKQEEVANKVGKKRSTIANYLRLLSLPKVIQDTLSSQRISMGHAKVILSLEHIHHQLLLHEKILNDSLTVREAEEICKKLQTHSEEGSAAQNTHNIHLEDLAKRLQDAFGTRVDLIEGKKESGRITIHYHNYDDLDRLLQCMMLKDG
ncbi:MAG: ParB/RepB/Spo0J family partition protein [Chlamydiales bacterium]|nr:ParB/RepB/Spo0J family partition protein [Chlamydiales bacterium]